MRLSVYKIQLQYIRFNKIEKRFLSMPKRSNLSIYLFCYRKRKQNAILHSSRVNDPRTEKPTWQRWARPGDGVRRRYSRAWTCIASRKLRSLYAASPSSNQARMSSSEISFAVVIAGLRSRGVVDDEEALHHSTDPASRTSEALAIS